MTKQSLITYLAHQRVLDTTQVQNEDDLLNDADGNYKDDVQELFNEYCDYYTTVLSELPL